MAELEWKTIDQYPNYEISSDGKVRNKKTMKLLCQTLSTNGYYYISLCDKGHVCKLFVHRLVASHFILNPENKPCIDHINFNKVDNSVRNLRWCTLHENNFNKPKQSNNKSGVPGVSWDKSRNKWAVAIQLNGRKVFSCRFDDFDHAVSIRKAKEQEYFGEFAPQL